MKFLKAEFGYMIEHDGKNYVRFVDGTWIEDEKLVENCILPDASKDLEKKFKQFVKNNHHDRLNVLPFGTYVKIVDIHYNSSLKGAEGIIVGSSVSNEIPVSYNVFITSKVSEEGNILPKSEPFVGGYPTVTLNPNYVLPLDQKGIDYESLFK